ncbi:hypothetical protein, partial [Halogeometricum sp. CBA1124]|uniref:hypothetical protein n=1 Tax=Halogeometricum sp. CBA1124 TaxID=2668071 RepID=UPI0037422A0C
HSRTPSSPTRRPEGATTRGSGPSSAPSRRSSSSTSSSAADSARAAADRPRATGAHGAGAVAAAFVAGAVFAPPDPLTQVRWFWPSLLVALPLSYYAFHRA